MAESFSFYYFSPLTILQSSLQAFLRLVPLLFLYSIYSTEQERILTGGQFNGSILAWKSKSSKVQVLILAKIFLLKKILRVSYLYNFHQYLPESHLQCICFLFKETVTLLSSFQSCFHNHLGSIKQTSHIICYIQNMVSTIHRAEKGIISTINQCQFELAKRKKE